MHITEFFQVPYVHIQSFNSPPSHLHFWPLGNFTGNQSKI